MSSSTRRAVALLHADRDPVVGDIDQGGTRLEQEEAAAVGGLGRHERVCQRAGARGIRLAAGDPPALGDRHRGQVAVPAAGSPDAEHGAVRNLPAGLGEDRTGVEVALQQTYEREIPLREPGEVAEATCRVARAWQRYGLPTGDLVEERGGRAALGGAWAPLHLVSYSLVRRRSNGFPPSPAVAGRSPIQKRGPGPRPAARSPGFASVQRSSERQPHPMHSVSPALSRSSSAMRASMREAQVLERRDQSVRVGVWPEGRRELSRDLRQGEADALREDDQGDAAQHAAVVAAMARPRPQ